MGYREKYFSKNDAYDNNNGWYRCVKCGRSFRKGDMDIDHIIPQKYGGSDRETNLQCICKHCNRSKQASMKDTPKDLLRSSKRVAKRELSERKMIFDIAEEPRMIFLIAITETIGFMVYTHNPTDVFLSMALWFLCAGKNVRARKITECLFGSHLVSFIILESLCAAGIVPLGKTIKSGHLVASYSLGF